MYPLDPLEPSENSPKPPMAPPYVDENLGIETTEAGLRAAEDDKREAMTGVYEDQALDSDDPEGALNDIAYSSEEETETSPEVRAMREEKPPMEDNDR